MINWWLVSWWIENRWKGFWQQRAYRRARRAWFRYPPWRDDPGLQETYLRTVSAIEVLCRRFPDSGGASNTDVKTMFFFGQREVSPEEILRALRAARIDGLIQQTNLAPHGHFSARYEITSLGSGFLLLEWVQLSFGRLPTIQVPSGALRRPFPC